MRLTEQFRPKWTHLIAQLNGDLSQADAVYDQLVAHYTGPDRHYHDFAHIVWMLNLLPQMAVELENRPAVELAIWFHDVIYEVGTGLDNEQASADFSAEVLGRLHISQDEIQTVKTLILDTKHHQRPATWDGCVLVDLDLSQLGNSAEQFAHDTANIRREYQIFPDAQFWPGRRQVLQLFLNRDQIYYTEPFYKRFEASARRNLADSIVAINQGYPIAEEGIAKDAKGSQRNAKKNLHN